jgi:hypothetical protein
MNLLTRYLAIGSALVALLVVSPSESQACFGWFRRDRCDPCATTTYRPLFGGWFSGWRGNNNCCAPACAPACNPCATQTCQYVPQTCFRTECVSVPVTTFRCCRTCDPCTGCPTTVMRPVTTMVQQVRRVPVTTYRLVAAPSCCATPSVSSFAPATSSGCSTCGTASAVIGVPTTTVTPAPSSTLLTPAPAFSPPASTTIVPSGSSNGSSTVVPSLPSTSNSIQTYEGSSYRPPVQPPIPRVDEQSPVLNRDVDAEDDGEQDRTASLPRGGEWTKSNRPVILPAVHSQEVVKKSANDGGWRPSNR